jgi:hypothetical protein
VTPSTEVAPAQSGGVPALYTPPPLEIDANDMVLPRIYFAHPSSDQVEAHSITTGAIFSAAGEDDPDPQILWDPKKHKDKPGVLFHVLGMWKGRSATVDGKLERYAFSDPNAPADSWVTYNYTLALPEGDTDVPYKMLLTKSKAGAAKSINTVLAKRASAGPAYLTAFRMTSIPKKNDKGSYSIPQIRVVESTPTGVEIAERLAMMAAASVPNEPAPVAGRSDEPAI